MMCLPAGLGLCKPDSGGGSAYPVYEGNATYSYNAAAGTQRFVTLPSGIEAGDLLIMQLQYATTFSTVTTPSGWTQIGALNVTDRDRIWYRIATGGEGSTVEVTSNGLRATVAITHRIRKGTFDSSTAPSVTLVDNGATNSANPPSHTPSWGSADTLWITGFFGNNAAATTYPYPDGNQKIASAAPGSGASTIETASCYVAEHAASLDPAAFTRSVGTPVSVRSFTLAVRPV